jgi:glutamate 5-kinase
MSVVVAKIGTSSVADAEGGLRTEAIARLCEQVADVRADGHLVVVVTSGAISAGLPLLGLGGERRPKDAPTLQAVSAVGQGRLMASYSEAFGDHGLVAGQVLLAPLDFMVRAQYLQARQTLARLLELGVVPVVNENDAIADDEIRFGDNDRLAALVAHLVDAELLVLLTDTAGLHTADPRLDTGASLIEEIVEVDQTLVALAGGPGTPGGSGGMASKLAAAKLAAWTGVRTVIAAADRPSVLADALAGVPGVGTVVHPHDRRLPARKLWIAFAVGAKGRLLVDDGAEAALRGGRASLLAAGVRTVEGTFEAGDAVEVVGPSGVLAKGLVAHGSATVERMAGRRSDELPDGSSPWVIHVDDLVIVPG